MRSVTRRSTSLDNHRCNMYKVLKPIKDTYITNRYVNNVPQVTANVGAAGSLDLFKLYGVTSTASGTTSVPNTELSRLLVQFDLDPLRELVEAGAVDPGDPSFSCHLRMSDVYGGQPTPSNFTVNVCPMSASFDEGLGRDVVFYSDSDVCNWLTGSSTSGAWLVEGCGFSGSAGPTPCDYIIDPLFEASQAFKTGLEDLYVDITSIVSATLAGALPDEGLRISFDPSMEDNQYTYFVKRFASRSAYNEDKRPNILVKFDDSIQDDTNDGVFLDSTSYLFLYNYVRSGLTNLMSGSSAITGADSIILQLTTPVSGGIWSGYFTGSQHTRGVFPVTGIYSCSVDILSSDPLLQPQWQASGSITFTPIWQSLDGTLPYLTGSTFKAYPPQRGAQSLAPHRFVVSVYGVADELDACEKTTLRVNIFDYSAPYVTTALKLPVDLPGIVVRDVHYQVRDVMSDQVVVPFDTKNNSTRVSSDSTGMYFTLDASNLKSGNSYIIDVMVFTDNNKQLYKSASPAFRIGGVA